jgi:hypothetical protein
MQQRPYHEANSGTAGQDILFYATRMFVTVYMRTRPPPRLI